MSQDGDIFSKLTPSERSRLFKDLTTARGEISCKGESDTVYRLVAERTTPRDEIQCTIPFGLDKPTNEKELLGTFFLGGERYFLKSPVRFELEFTNLRTDVDVFHLQRRQNYRIRIPENYQAHIDFTELNNGPTKIKAKLSDLSTGGCRVILETLTPLLVPGDRLSGAISIGPRESLEIEGTVRHHKVEKGALNSKQIFGLEFKPLSPLLEGKMFAITMDLHREFFSRYNT